MRYFSMYAGIAGFEKGVEDAEEIAQRESRNSIGAEVAEPEQPEVGRDNARGKRILRQQDMRGSCPSLDECRKHEGEASSWDISQEPFSCVGYSEIDRYASAIYRYHYPDLKNYGDATRIVPSELPDFDCIVGGFPCQSFSIAGRREAFSDIRGTLFFEICRIAGVKKPPFLWLENVKGLLSAPYTEAVQEWAEEDFDEDGEPTKASLKKHKAVPGTKGWVFLTILNTLWELGYDCQWQLLNSKFHGVPQNRERVFIVGHLGEQPRPQIFPLRQDDEILGGTQEETRGNGARIRYANTLSQRYGKDGSENLIASALGVGGSFEMANYIMHQNKSWIRTPHNEAQALRSGASHNYQTLETYAITDSGLHREKQVRTNILPPLRSERGCDRQDTVQIVSRSGIRRLTPIECERLQGFPDNWTKHGLFEDGQVKEISDTQRYKCLGNAVTTNVIRDILLQWHDLSNPRYDSPPR